MRETNREQIRRALDECLSGMDGRPSLEKRVLARAKGERRGPRRLSLALAVALLITSRKQRRQRREKLEKQRRQRQEELGKTNRFTPVKRAAHRRAEKNEKDGQT